MLVMCTSLSSEILVGKILFVAHGNFALAQTVWTDRNLCTTPLLCNNVFRTLPLIMCYNGYIFVVWLSLHQLNSIYTEFQLIKDFMKMKFIIKLGKDGFFSLSYEVGKKRLRPCYGHVSPFFYLFRRCNVVFYIT